MIIQNLSQVGLIWDLDNTLYRDDTPEMDTAYEIAGANAAIECGVPLTFKEAKQFAHDSYLDGLSYAEAFVAKYGIDHAEYYDRFHTNMDHTCVVVHDGIHDQFRKIGVANNVLVTHSGRNWAERVVAWLGLQEWFPSERIIASEDYAFAKKSHSAVPFELALKVLDIPPTSVIVIEDSSANLQIPFTMGMRTVHISHGKTLDPKPDYIDFQVPTLTEAMTLLGQINPSDLPTVL